MRRISDELFVKGNYDMDGIVAIRVKDGEFYFLAWMEDAPHYKIQKAMNSDGYLLDRSGIVIDGDVFAEVEMTKEYDNMYLLYCMDSNGNLSDEEDNAFSNAYEKFLTLVNCYERNGQSDENDHEILELTREELSSICEVLRDGDYILIVEDY